MAGREVVILGRGATLGRPLAMLLGQKRPTANAAVTVVHTGVPDWQRYTRRADILVAAAGVPGIIQPEHVRPGAGHRRAACATRAGGCCRTWTRRRRGGRGDHAAGRRGRARPRWRCCSATPSPPPNARAS